MKKKKIFYVILLSFMIINISQLGNFDIDAPLQILNYPHGTGRL